MPKVDFNTEIKGPDDETLKWADGSPTTLRKVAVEACGALSPADQNMSGEDKAKLWFLAVRVQATEAIDLTVDEASLLKKRIGIVFGPFVVGPAFQLLEGKPERPDT